MVHVGFASGFVTRRVCSPLVSWDPRAKCPRYRCWWQKYIPTDTRTTTRSGTKTQEVGDIECACVLTGDDDTSYCFKWVLHGGCNTEGSPMPGHPTSQDPSAEGICERSTLASLAARLYRPA